MIVTRRHVYVLGWSVFVALIGVAIAIGGHRRTTVLIAIFMWWVACVAYIQTVDSRKPLLELLKNVVLACCFAAAVTYCNHGAPESDEDGYIVDEGFEATAREKGAAAARVFGRIAVSTLCGVALALLVRRGGQSQVASAGASRSEFAPHEDGFPRDEAGEAADDDGG